MSKTFIVDWPVVIALGVAFGAFAREYTWWKARAFYAGLLTTAVFAAVAVVSYVVAPHWMWMYFVSPAHVAWIVPLVPLAYLGVFVLSFAAAVALQQLGRRALWGAFAAACLAEVVLVVATWDRYRAVGTAEQWAQGTAYDLLTVTPSGPARTIGMLGPVFVVVLGVSFYSVYRKHREARSHR